MAENMIVYDVKYLMVYWSFSCSEWVNAEEVRINVQNRWEKLEDGF